MNLLDDKLESLITVCEEKNFTKAGIKLGLTQPAVSNHMKKLEEELGITLFLQKKGDLELTIEGQIVLLYAKRMKALLEKMNQKIIDAKNNLQNLRIGITQTQESGLMLEVLSKMAIEDDKLSITIITDTIKNLYDKLDNFEIDLAIIEGKPSNHSFNYIMLDTDYLSCIASPEHKFKNKSIITLNDLKKEHLILRLPDSSTRQLFESTLEGINDSIKNFDVTVEVDNISTIKSLIQKNIGVTILATNTCQKEIKKGKLISLPIENLNMIRETNLVYHKNFQYNDILNTIIKLYNEANKKLNW